VPGTFAVIQRPDIEDGVVEKSRQGGQALVTTKTVLDIDLIRKMGAKPKVFEPGEPLFWNDPHISGEMLKAHLDPNTDAASRRPEMIDQTVSWLISHLGLKPGDKLLDLGCGPGLYCERFHDHGLVVTGMDYSRRSIDYARKAAADSGRNIEYIYQDYLTLDFESRFDAIVLIYCDLAVFAPAKRDELLRRVHRALKPKGAFAFDVFTPDHRPAEERLSWSAHERGFWRPNPHLCLTCELYYPDEETYLDQYVVIDEDLTVKVYRIWDKVYTPESIEPVVRAQGFNEIEFRAGLTGKPYAKGEPCLGVICRK
jgi:SAM-dependent methyltransferase